MHNLNKPKFLFFILLIFIPLKDAFSENYNKKAMRQYVEGMSFLEKGKTDKAIKNFEKAIKSKTSFYMAYYRLGEIYIDKKDFEKVEYMLKKVVEINPNFLPVHLDLGELYLEIKQNTSAINSFEKVIELDPNYFAAHYNLGHLYAEIGELNRAKKEFENAASIVPDNEIVLKYLNDINKRLEPQKEKVDNLDNASDTTQQKSSFQSQASQQIPEKHLTLNNYILILGISITFVCTVISLPFLVNYLTIRSKARKDYKLSRGTQHLKQIKASLKILNKRIQAFTKKKIKLKQDLKELEDERFDKLYRSLSTHLLKTRLYEVEGIGPKLREAIINEYSNGTLDGLRYAYERINGIGEQKQQAISYWISILKDQLPELLKQDFPNKEKIIQEYETKTKELKTQYGKIIEMLNLMEEINKMASFEENRLSKVRVSQFMKARRNNKEASLVVNEYIKGVFPEWLPMPTWYKTLITEYGG